jgi:N-acetyl sugar amidotransferase
VTYCARCVTPDTRPNVVIGLNGICSACLTHGVRPAINWGARAKVFEQLIAESKARSTGYDCVIPVSGGKDSTWQVVTCLEYGLKPLAVTWKAPCRTAIGAANLANLVSLGVDHIDYQVSPAVERRFLYRAFVRHGATAIPMHMAMFNIPTMIAVRFGIPLIVWGENSATEYGDGAGAEAGWKLDRAWLQKYGVTHGTTAKDWIGDGLTASDMVPYMGPSDEQIESAGVRAVFLGYFTPWDPETSLQVASAHGFRRSPDGPKTGYYDYADIDDDFISIHHYLKWYKFGITRLFDNLSLEIRNGRMTRDHAIAIIRNRGEQRPSDDIAKFCEFVGISETHFDEIAETFRNPCIWSRRDGVAVIEGFIVPDWKWS